MNKPLIIIVVIFTSLLLTLAAFVNYYNNKSNRNLYKKDVYKGIVYKKITESNRHGNSYLVVIDESDTFNISLYEWPYLWEYAELGDTLIKPADTLLLYVKKKNGTVKTIIYKEQGNNFLLYFWIIVFSILIIYNIQKSSNK